ERAPPWSKYFSLHLRVALGSIRRPVAIIERPANGTEVTMRACRFRLIAQAVFMLVAMPPWAYAQQIQPPPPAEAAAAMNPAPATFSKQQLDQMLAPIALYPDQLLMQVLMAATFPQQVIEAGQWLQDPNNASLKDDKTSGSSSPPEGPHRD